MTIPTPRRTFLASSGAAAASSVLFSQLQSLHAQSPSNQIVVGVMGLGRGQALANSFARLDGVVVKYLCDVDAERMATGVAGVEAITGRAPQAVVDVRKILDDQDVDVLVCAAPNHWHAPATILGCAAGKHVYVEKPCCHNPREGEWMVAAARKHRRAVQMGSQRRSGPATNVAMRKLHEGKIGRVYLAKAWYTNARPTIGRGMPEAVPGRLDYELWQGPAPRRDYRSNVVHYNWHWFWHWGNGELGNNGVHTLDLCRWGLDVHFPSKVTSSGGRYQFDDDQETPDTHTVCFDFKDQKSIVWEGRSCNRHETGFIHFYGTEGTLELESNGAHTIYDARDKVVERTGSNSQGDVEHIVNFLEAIRTDRPLELNAEIEKGYQSTLLSHLGNIAHRVGRTLHCNDRNGHILNDEPAMALWGREYAPGWEPRV
ncbi:MAG: Gfo/Idh/MocA family protein [Pirellulaceae bacterium]